jgi:hypothetical protein
MRKKYKWLNRRNKIKSYEIEWKNIFYSLHINENIHFGNLPQCGKKGLSIQTAMPYRPAQTDQKQF